MTRLKRLVLVAVLVAWTAGCGDAPKDAGPNATPPATDVFDKTTDPALKGKTGPKAS